MASSHLSATTARRSAAGWYRPWARPERSACVRVPRAAGGQLSVASPQLLGTPTPGAEGGGSPREVDQDDVGILSDAVEHDLFPITCDIECLDPAAAITQMCELTCGLRRHVEEPEVRCGIGRPEDETF